MFIYCNRVARYLALVATSLFAPSASAQTFALSDHLSRLRIAAAMASLPSNDRQSVAAAVGEVFPVFVFIPGIMGSKLTKTLADGTQKLIWGEMQGAFAKPDADLAYSENDRVEPEVLNEYYAVGRGFDIYGKAIHSIRSMDLSVGDNVRLFSYDWRQPNAKSSADLSKWFCKSNQRTALSGRPVVFIAHSMGGLVLKRWLKHAYEANGCEGSADKFAAWIKVKKIVFLGTPHFGAPKAIAAFADKYYLLVDPDTVVGRVFGGLDATFLSAAVNHFGATFPSAYELLPIVNTTSASTNLTGPTPLKFRKPTELCTGGLIYLTLTHGNISNGLSS